MHIPNQHSQHVYYFPPYQNSSLIGSHLGQGPSNVHLYQRIQPTPNMHKINQQFENNRSRVPAYEQEHDQLSFRKDNTKMNTLSTEGSLSRYTPPDFTNPESTHIGGSRAAYPINQQNSQRNKSLLQVKRKQSTNSNNREVREQYYKGQQQTQQLLKKLPQLEFQQLTRVNPNRQYNASPSTQLKIKQQKKATSPFGLHARSNSFKQTNIQVIQLKKMESIDIQQNKKLKEGLKFHSPLKNTHYQVSKSFKQHDSKSKFMTPNTQRYTESPDNSKKQSTPDTSNSTSILFESPQFKPTGISFKTPEKSGSSYRQSKSEAECQANMFDQAHKKQILRLLQIVKKRQQQLDQQKVVNHQKDIKIKNLQHQINAQKINFQRKLLVTEKQFVHKKQMAINQLKQEYEKQLLKNGGQIKQRYSKEIKQIQIKSQNLLTQFKKQHQKHRNQLIFNLDEKQKKIIQYSSKILQLEKLKYVSQQKLAIIQQQLHKRNQAISNLRGKQQQQKKAHAKFAQQSTNTEVGPNLGQNSVISVGFSQNSPLVEQLSQKNRSLQQKISNYLINIQKNTQKYKECKSELQKMLRKNEQLSNILFDRDATIRNMGKDFRNRQKYISQLKKSNQCLQELVSKNSDNLMRAKCQMLNEKYKMC